MALLKLLHKSTKLERLYYKYRYIMYTEAYNILQDSHLAEDALSESFLRIEKNQHKIDENNIEKTKSFLVTICRNVAKDIYNKRNNASTIPHDEAYIELQNPLDVVITNESLAQIAQEIERLSPETRDTFILNIVHNMSIEEISKILNINKETVKKRLYRAKQQIKNALKKEGIDYEKEYR